MTTAELDAIGRKLLEDAGAQSAPELSYKFPAPPASASTRRWRTASPDRDVPAGRSREYRCVGRKAGFFADTGASFAVPPVKREIERLCRDGKRALWVGLNEVRSGRPLASIGNAIGLSPARTAIRWSPTSPATRRPLASRTPDRNRHLAGPAGKAADGGGHGLHHRTLPLARRRMGGRERRRRSWTLYSEPRAPTVQYEHTVVVTKNGPLVVTLAG